MFSDIKEILVGMIGILTGMEYKLRGTKHH